MTQLEHPANLDRFDNRTYRLITIVLMRSGLRVTDALRLRADCITTDAEGAPYLRYFNHKMRRDALVPIDAELVDQINEHRRRTLDRWPGGPLADAAWAKQRLAQATQALPTGYCGGLPLLAGHRTCALTTAFTSSPPPANATNSPAQKPWPPCTSSTHPPAHHFQHRRRRRRRLPFLALRSDRRQRRDPAPARPQPAPADPNDSVPATVQRPIPAPAPRHRATPQPRTHRRKPAATPPTRCRSRPEPNRDTPPPTTSQSDNDRPMLNRQRTHPHDRHRHRPQHETPAQTTAPAPDSR
ncbi:Tyr recombinase domain-containing protein [Mycobacterium sp. smrl_JER01]